MEMIPLWEDQINSDAWIKHCDFAFDEYNDPYVSQFDIQRFHNKNGLAERGTIFCGTTQSIHRCLSSINEKGNYILITRDIDIRITQDIFDSRPKSIKHWFAINCQIKHPGITAIPYGCNSILGFSENLKIIFETVERNDPNNKIFCRINIPNELPYDHERHKCIQQLINNPKATVILKQISALEMFTEMRKHIFVAAPIGVGDDCLRMCESIIMGAIPVLTDCPTTRQFEDLPVAYTTDWNITEDWCMEQREIVKDKSTERIRMSYWANQLKNKKLEYGL